MGQITIVAIDLAKQSFQVRGVNQNGKALLNRKIQRENLLEQIKQFPNSAVIAMEACGSAHFWGRLFEAEGYKVKLIAPQYVKPFVKSQKNDNADAEGIADAASRSNMRFIPVKSVHQQDIQSMHRVRERYVGARTSLMNELRGLFMEYGVIMPQGRAALRKQIEQVISVQSVTEVMRCLARELYDELLELENRIEQITKKISSICASNDICKRLMSIPGIAAISATALYASVGHMKFKNGRELAAFLD